MRRRRCNGRCRMMRSRVSLAVHTKRIARRHNQNGYSMSALLRITDSSRTSSHVRKVPGRDSCTATNWTLVSRLNLGAPVLPLVRPRQYDLKLSEESGLRLDIDAATMLFHDDVVAHRQAKPGVFARGFGRKEWVEYFGFGLARDAGSIFVNTDFTPFFTTNPAGED